MIVTVLHAPICMIQPIAHLNLANFGILHVQISCLLQILSYKSERVRPALEILILTQLMMIF